MKNEFIDVNFCGVTNDEKIPAHFYFLIVYFKSIRIELYSKALFTFRELNFKFRKKISRRRQFVIMLHENALRHNLS